VSGRRRNDAGVAVVAGFDVCEVEDGAVDPAVELAWGKARTLVAASSTSAGPATSRSCTPSNATSTAVLRIVDSLAVQPACHNDALPSISDITASLNDFTS
jgi:hypothetical protein